MSYLYYCPNLFCSMACKWCIQEHPNEFVRAIKDKSNHKLVIEWLKKNRFLDTLAIAGGEATLHPGFKEIIEELSSLYKITVTTNLFSGLYKDMPGFIEWAKKFSVRWNTSYHPAQNLSVDVFIERVKAMKAADLNIDQVASVDSHELSNDYIRKLLTANIGWTLQYNTGVGVNTGQGIRPDPNGELKPRTQGDIRTYLPLAWNDWQKYVGANYSKYHEACGKVSLQTVQCATDRIIIGPDDHIYTCHSLTYMQRKDLSLGHISTLMDLKERGYKFWTPIKCDQFGRCDPCDVGCMKIKKDNCDWESY